MSNAQYRSARRFTSPPRLFRWCKEHGFFDNPARALTFGAGFLVEAEELARLRWAVDAVETGDSIDRRAELYSGFASRSRCRVLPSLDEARLNYQIVTATHVLEFVEDPVERHSLLCDLGRRLAPKGYLLLSLRGWSDVGAAKNQTPRGDGIVTGLGTWTRGYTREEALQLMTDAELTLETSPQGVRSRSPEQVRLVCRKR